MKITIITASYNSEATIQATLQSVASQTYIAIEHIVVDGNSQDNTLTIVQKFPHIARIISEPDSGIYDAFNKGIQIATGDIIGILNSDDFFADNEVVSRIVSAFERSKSEIVYADIDFVASDNRTVVRHYSSKFFKPWMFRYGFQPAHPTFYTRKSNFEKYGYYRTDFKIAGDFELLLRFLLKHKLSYKYIGDTWVKMRLGGASTSGVRGSIKMNREVLSSIRTNHLYSNIIMVYSRYVIKWWGFLIKKKQ